MATGSGKTISALIAATRAQSSAARMLLVVAVPYRPLLKQWMAEVERFGVTPTELPSTPPERESCWRRLVRELELKVTSTVAVVVTHHYLVSNEFSAVLERIPEGVDTMLIADEVHNLGRPAFLRQPPVRFRYRLGLSATPERQYDEAGTKAIKDFFGPAVFEFGLESAIGNCLVPYRYKLVPVFLTEEEVADWDQLTEELRRSGFGSGAEDAEDAGPMPARIVKLLVKRRAIAEGAENKIAALANELSDSPAEIRHTLIYASDKRPDQLVAVNALLRERGILFHQITQSETGNRKQMADVLTRFAAGEIQVLTAKRVLDEGVDIPETQTAYLLASSTVRRQWIQRRGRVLRMCSRLNKTEARIVDFLALPPSGAAGEGRGLLAQELSRAQEFARLAEDAGKVGGALDLIEELMLN